MKPQFTNFSAILLVEMLKFSLISIVLMNSINYSDSDYTSYVKPISADIFTKYTQPTDTNSQVSAKVVVNANKYALNDWWKLKFGTNDTAKYLDFHGTDENHIRPMGMEAISLAISLKTKIYDQSVTGKTAAEAEKNAIHLIVSLAYRHKANSNGGWGDGWQTALWAHYAGWAAWLLWDSITDQTDREYIEKMVIHEANTMMAFTVPYYQDTTGKVITPGDTKAEENSWDSCILQVATAMMPTHPNWKAWMKKNVELLISSFVRPSDLKNTTIINGKAVKDWIHGTNVFENGTLVNHNIIHPDYIVDMYTNLRAVPTYTLAGMATPEAAFWNDWLLYSALTTLHFDSPPFNKPGGTIYVRDSAGKATDGIYLPQGDDWGVSRRVQFALFDTCMELLSTRSKSYSPNEWSLIHIEAQYKMQQRFTSGKTYDAQSEDTYANREEWVAKVASINYITRWIAHNSAIKVSSENYS